jgi:hypothetical protein
MNQKNQSEHFEAEAGDTVVVRVRENGTRGRLRAKFVGTVTGFRTGAFREKIVIEAPWDESLSRSVKLGPSDAQIEIVDDADDVTF